MVLLGPWYYMAHGIMLPMVLEGPWYLHEFEIIKGIVEYGFNITLTGEKEIFNNAQHHICKRQISSCSQQSRSQFEITSFLGKSYFSVIGSRVDLGFVYLDCREDFGYLFVFWSRSGGPLQCCCNSAIRRQTFCQFSLKDQGFQGKSLCLF